METDILSPYHRGVNYQVSAYERFLNSESSLVGRLYSDLLKFNSEVVNSTTSLDSRELLLTTSLSWCSLALIDLCPMVHVLLDVINHQPSKQGFPRNLWIWRHDFERDSHTSPHDYSLKRLFDANRFAPWRPVRAVSPIA